MKYFDRRSKATVYVAFVLIILVIGIAIGTRRTRHRAVSFLRDAVALQVRVGTFEQVRNLAERYGGNPTSSECSAPSCAYSFEFKNTWLRILGLAPSTRLTCTLRVREGILDLRECLFISGNTSASFAASIWEMPHLPQGVPEPFHVSRQWSGARWRVYVQLTPEATSEQRRIAYSLNLDCLSRIGGCEDAQQLLPSVTWGDTQSNNAPASRAADLGGKPPLPFLYPGYVRGQAYLQSHQAGAAASEFQKILDHRGLTGGSPLEALAHLGLARARAMSGDASAARTAYQDFFAMWKDADPDIPILKQAKAEYAKLQ